MRYYLDSVTNRPHRAFGCFDILLAKKSVKLVHIAQRPRRPD
jgi:hypothetical protein